MPETQTPWGDNVLEDYLLTYPSHIEYFLELLVDKHIIDREIEDLIDVIEKSTIHPDYQKLIKRILFGNKNIYVENWWTLEGSLEDIVRNVNIRGDRADNYGIVLWLMLQVIETVFDVEDSLFNDFIMFEEKEDIEHELIILMKRILDFIQNALREMLSNIEHLDMPIEDHVRDEFLIVKAALLQYPEQIMESQSDAIGWLKVQVDDVVTKIIARKQEIKRLER